jgi:hypothetical protein
LRGWLLRAWLRAVPNELWFAALAIAGALSCFYFAFLAFRRRGG